VNKIIKINKTTKLSFKKVENEHLKKTLFLKFFVNISDRVGIFSFRKHDLISVFSFLESLNSDKLLIPLHFFGKKMPVVLFDLSMTNFCLKMKNCNF